MSPSPGDAPSADAWQAESAALGPFFAVEWHDDGRHGGPVRPPWRSMAELADGSPVLGERVAAVRARLAAGGGQPAEAVESRVAASVTHLGLVARVLSPFLAHALLHGRVPPVPPLAALRWQPVLGRPFPLSLPRSVTGQGAAAPAEAAAPADALADALAAGLLDGPLRELAAPFADLGVSPHIVRGNTASAVNGAAAMAASAAPGLAHRARTLATLLLERPPLRGAATRTPSGAFRRRSCCLIYRAAPDAAGALCGDCVLRRD
ncbi:(2Fe-2S)-binding protein [Streptomyces sp. V4-01]|uniref:(2Fe-2S)-binding protein n=1 Tax=Actinacidiphila polyblastidii TaxID=3110430 RepID=A0ABU7PER3_9ACTN|nr:(2Fe-2S)-binding protein [Streptomyces sp. V4-01]